MKTTLETSEENVDKTTLETSEEDVDKTTLETSEEDVYKTTLETSEACFRSSTNCNSTRNMLITGGFELLFTLVLSVVFNLHSF